MKTKSINSLMKYMRNHHHIRIEGSKSKNSLLNNGYYHSFKGYRYINNKYKFNKKELRLLVKDYENILNLFYKESNKYNYNKVIRTDTRKKIRELTKYI